MNTWYTKSLGDGMTGSMPADEIKESFLQRFHTAGSPHDMAVFTRLESEGRLHCELVAYFSPAATNIAQVLDARPCGQPSRTGLDLLAGDEHSWSVLFDAEK